MKKVIATAMFGAFVASGMAGTFASSIASATIQGQTTQATISTTDDFTSILTVTANNSQTSTQSASSTVFNIVYTPSPGETSPPTTAYVEVNFVDSFQQSSSSASAVALDITDGVTVVDQINPTFYSGMNGCAWYFGGLRASVSLTLQSNGTYSGTLTVPSNYIRASTVGVPGATAVAQQAVYIDTISASPISGTVIRQLALSGARVTIQPDAPAPNISVGNVGNPPSGVVTVLRQHSPGWGMNTCSGQASVSMPPCNPPGMNAGTYGYSNVSYSYPYKVTVYDSSKAWSTCDVKGAGYDRYTATASYAGSMMTGGYATATSYSNSVTADYYHSSNGFDVYIPFSYRYTVNLTQVAPGVYSSPYTALLWTTQTSVGWTGGGAPRPTLSAVATWKASLDLIGVPMT